MRRHDARDVRKQSWPVECLDFYGCLVETGMAVVPVDLDQPVVLIHTERLGVRAVVSVNGYSSSPGHEPNDFVARHRRTACGKSYEEIIEALYVNTTGGSRCPRSLPDSVKRFRNLFVRLPRRQLLVDSVDDRPR